MLIITLRDVFLSADDFMSLFIPRACTSKLSVVMAVFWPPAGVAGGQLVQPALQNCETIRTNPRVGCSTIIRLVRAMDPGCSRNPSTDCGGLSVFFTSGCRVDGIFIPRASFACSLCPGLHLEAQRSGGFVLAAPSELLGWAP